jgi:hypothetical protein
MHTPFVDRLQCVQLVAKWMLDAIYFLSCLVSFTSDQNKIFLSSVLDSLCYGLRSIDD